MSRIIIEEPRHRVEVLEDAVRVVTAAVPGPQGPKGDPGELPPANAGDLLVHGASVWDTLPAGSEGQVLSIASGLPAWAATTGGGGTTYINPYPINIPAQTASTYEWAIPGWYPTSLTSSGLFSASGRIVLGPILVTRTRTTASVGVNVTTAAAGGEIRIGLYASENGKPRQLVQEYGFVPADTTGQKIIELALPAELPPGHYWTAMSANNSGIVVSCINGTADSPIEALVSGPGQTTTICGMYTATGDPTWVTALPAELSVDQPYVYQIFPTASSVWFRMTN